MKATINIPGQHVEFVREQTAIELGFAGEAVTAVNDDSYGRPDPDEVRRAVARVNSIAGALEQIGWENSGDERRITIDTNHADRLLDHALEWARDRISDSGDLGDVRSFLEAAEWISETVESLPVAEEVAD